MFLFLLSLLLGIFSILVFQKTFRINKNEIFFSFLPFLFIYLGFISTLLSFKSSLTPRNFLACQIIIFLSVSLYYKLLKRQFAFFAFKRRVKQLIKKATYTVRQIIRSRRLLYLMLIFSITMLLLASFLVRSSKPLYDSDDKSYRGSAPLYWIQNKSIFRFESADERKNTLLYGTGLIYMWPNLFKAGEQAANIFYWLGFPLSVISLFLFSKLFTKKPVLAIFPSLFFLGTPIVYQNYSHTLTQETWLGLLLLSLGYFLIKGLNSVAPKNFPLLMFGICAAVSISIKTSSVVYLVLSFLFFKTSAKKSTLFIKIISGFLVASVLSGFIIALFQNNRIYGSVLGSKRYYSQYIFSGDYNQLITHLKRIPFVFVELPLFSKEISHRFSEGLNTYVKFMGADNKLRDEDKKWIGSYRYQLHHPNKFFGIGGVWLFTAFFIAVLSLFRNGKSNNSSYHLIYIFTFAALLSIMILTRWIETAGVPYRHLISGYTLCISFFAFYARKLHEVFGKILSYSLVVGVIVSSFQQLAVVSNNFDFIKLGKPEWQLNSERKHLLYDPFSLFLPYIRNQTSFLLVDSVNLNLPDYPFFWVDGQNSNKVHLFIFSSYSDNRINNRELFSKFYKIQPEFLVIVSNEFINTLTLEGEILERLTHVTTIDSHNYNAEIYQNKSNQINKIPKNI